MSGRMLKLNGLTSTIGAALPIQLRSKKKLCFDVTFTLQELVNCTFVSGVLFTKIQLKDGGSFSGISHRSEVENHSVQWDQDFNFSCKMYVSIATGLLEPCWCKISIRKEIKGGKSSSKFGFVKVNLAEYAGVGVGQRKYLLESYNENKHKLDNSLLKVKIYLRQTSGDTIFRRPEVKTYDIMPDEDEGFDELWSGHSHRASTASTTSTYSTGTSVWSNISGSAINLKSSTGDVSKDKETLPIVTDVDRESASDDTIVDQNNTTKIPSPVGMINQTSFSKTPSSNDITPSPLLGGAPSTLTPSSGSFKDLRHSPVLRKQNQTNSDYTPPITMRSVSSLQRPKVGPTIQLSRVTATPGGSLVQHHRQASASMASPPVVPSPLTGHSHKRHSSFGTYLPREYSETTSLSSAKTRASMLSNLEQSRVDNESLIHQLIVSHDLTPTSDGDEDSNLKLYFDKHSGVIKLAGYDLDRSHFKEIDVHNELIEIRPRPRPRHKHKQRSVSELYEPHPQVTSPIPQIVNQSSS